jgi:RNA recognition motif-containing protein
MSTIRVQNIHLTASKDEVKKHFSSVSTVVARCSLERSHDDRSKQVATVTFTKNKMLKAALHADNTMSNTTSDTRIEIDDHFRGFTVVAGGLNHEIECVLVHSISSDSRLTTIALLRFTA